MTTESKKELIPLDDSLCKSDQTLQDDLRVRERDEQMVVRDWALKTAPKGMVNVATFEEDITLPSKSSLIVKSFNDGPAADDEAKKHLADNGLVALTWGPAAIGGKKVLLIVAHKRAPKPAGQNETKTTGGAVSVGVTTYSGPQSDFTTFLDINPAQRPAKLAEFWTGKGYDIAAQEAKLKARGIKTGTLDYDDAFNGAYAKLESDRTCASCRFPGGSVLAMKNPDGTPYDPTGKNPTGEYTVTDTGNAKLTYDKPDIFTNTPELYRNTLDDIRVFLVSAGTKMAKQYKVAQSRYA